MRYLLILTAAITAPALSACATTGELDGGCEVGENGSGEYWKCDVRGRTTFSAPQSAGQLTNYFNPYQAMFSFDGSTVSIPSTGFYTVSAFDSSGSVLDTYSNTWVLQSNAAVAQDGLALDNWLNSVPSGVVEVQAELIPFSVGYQQGLNTFSAEAIQGGAEYGSMSTTFYSDSCGGSGPFNDPMTCL